MIKLLGAMLLVISGALIGRFKARKLAERPGQIRRFVVILGQLETEIAYGFTPLPSALIKLGKQAGQPLSSLLVRIGEKLQDDDHAVMDIWQHEITAGWNRTAMRNAEMEIVLALGLTLGTTDRDNQLKHLKLAAKQLESMESIAIEEQNKYEKMWKSLGLLGGALIAVILY